MSTDTPLADEERLSHLVDRISHAVRSTLPPPAPRRIVAERNGRHYFLTQADIDSIEADRNYVDIRVGPDTFTLRWTMQQAEAALDPQSFLRIHRSTIVNLHKIREVERGINGQYLVTLANGQRCNSGRAYRQRIRAHLKNGK